MVERLKIKLNFSGDTFLNIPLTLQTQMVDQSELIERDFVDVEMENAVNPIVDYEKVRFTPMDNVNPLFQHIIKEIRYNISLLSNGSYVNNWGEIGFTQDDIKFRRNRFMNSFLTLKFYDSNIPTNQNLIAIMTIYPFIRSDFYNPGGVLKPVNTLPVRFVLTDPVKNPAGFAEGFYFYYYKQPLVIGDAPVDLYMRATFNNAATGKATNLMFANTPQSIIDVIPKVFCKFQLIKNNTGYYYSVENISGFINSTVNDMTLNMYEINVL
jgi:hypothetical protein